MKKTLQRKSADVPGDRLADVGTMVEVLDELGPLGWRGGISRDESGWRLELNAESPPRTLVAKIGDWVVLDAGVLRVLSDAECLEQYDVDGDDEPEGGGD